MVNENTIHTFSAGMRSIRMNTSISCHDFSGFNLLMTLVSCMTTAEIETTPINYEPRTQFCPTYVVMQDTIDGQVLKACFIKWIACSRCSDRGDGAKRREQKRKPFNKCYVLHLLFV